MGCPCHAKISIWEIHIDAAIAKVNIVCPVEDIEELKPELKNDSFRKMRVFVKVDIGLIEVRSAEPLRLPGNKNRGCSAQPQSPAQPLFDSIEPPRHGSG